MSRTTPKGFQQAAIASGTAIFAECKRQLDAAGDDAMGRAAAIAHHGVLLLEAPTGAGKTLVAGHLAEGFSAVEGVVWFWFAPFKGVVGQTAAALRAELPGLRLRELSEDRNASDSRSGDVWVTTWQTVATRVKDRRNVHKPGEQNLTVEELIAGLSDDALNRVPPDGGWAIRNTLSHLRDAQGVLDFRVDLFLQEAHPVLESKAVFAWAKNESERPPSARDIFDTYRASRAQTLRKLESFAPFDWERTGEHEEFGTVTLRQQVSYFAAHESTHLGQIQSLIP